MALTFTKKLAMNLGNKKFVGYDITHDGTVTTVDAASIELHYIDHAIAGTATQGSSVTTNNGQLAVTSGAYVQLVALSANAVTSIWAFGW
jgi:hypothetical protein